MKLFFTFVCLTPLLAFSQPKSRHLPGLWVRYKFESLDGNSSLDTTNSQSFLKYKFSKDGVATVGTDPLLFGIKRPYDFDEGDATMSVGAIKWKVEKSSRDTLILASPSNVQYFTNVGQINLGYKASYDAALQDSVYNATEYLFPECADNEESFFLFGNLLIKDGEGKVSVHFVVDKKGKPWEVTTVHDNKISQNLVDFVQKTFEKSSWSPAVVKGVTVNVSVDLDIRFYHIDIKGQQVPRVAMTYPFMPASMQ